MALEWRRNLNRKAGTIVPADAPNSADGCVAWQPCRVHKPTPYPAWALAFEPVRSAGGWLPKCRPMKATLRAEAIGLSSRGDRTCATRSGIAVAPTFSEDCSIVSAG